MLFNLLVLFPGLLVLSSIVAVGLWQTRHFVYSPLTHPIESSSCPSFRRRVFRISVIMDRLLMGTVLTFEGIARDLLWVREILVGLFDLDIKTSTTTNPSSGNGGGGGGTSAWMRRAMNLLQTQRRVSARVQGHYVRELATEQFTAAVAANSAALPAATTPTPSSSSSSAAVLALPASRNSPRRPSASSLLVSDSSIPTNAAPWDEEPATSSNSSVRVVDEIDDFLATR